MSLIFDDILAGLGSARLTMENQTSKICEIMEKSNSTLLHIETQINDHGHTTIMSQTSNAHTQNVYNFNSECEMALVKILNQFQELVRETFDTTSQTDGCAIDGLAHCRQRVEYLGSSVRKLQSLCDTALKMKFSLQEKQHNKIENEPTDDE